MLGDFIRNGFFEYDPKKNSPWGSVQQYKVVAPGIVEVSTAGHGGYAISVERYNSLPVEVRNFQPWAGTGWYEEDCDWAILVLSFPSEFKAHYGGQRYQDAVDAAIRTIRIVPTYGDDYFESVREYFSHLETGSDDDRDDEDGV